MMKACTSLRRMAVLLDGEGTMQKLMEANVRVYCLLLILFESSCLDGGHICHDKLLHQLITLVIEDL